MTELLTESFCERCGTRYTFESVAPRKGRLGRVRTISKGMKNFVLSDDASFSEAMAEARSEEELAAVAHQLDAFHQTFNFCLTCRQYTCGDCWNTAEGRCLTCAPIPGMEEPVRQPVVEAAAPVDAPGAAEPELAWPDADLSAARLSRAMGFDAAEAEATAEADETFDLDAALLAAAALAPAGALAADAVADAPEAAAAPEPVEAAEAVADAPHLRGLAPGQTLEDAIAQYEAQMAPEAAPVTESVEAETVVADVAPAEVPEPAVAAVAPVADVAALAADPEPAPVAADEEPSLDPLAAALAAAALAAPVEDELHDVPAPVALEPEAAPAATAAQPADAPQPVTTEAEPVAAREDLVAQPVWPAPAPTLGNGAAPAANPWLTVAPDEGGAEQPQWPAAPQWPSQQAAFRDSPATLAGRPLLPQDDASALWAASAAEVLSGAPARAPLPQAPAPAAPSAQPCVSCGLSLSANARFCRRCGTRQG